LARETLTNLHYDKTSWVRQCAGMLMMSDLGFRAIPSLEELDRLAADPSADPGMRADAWLTANGIRELVPRQLAPGAKFVP
jgi:hypothetical protein